MSGSAATAATKPDTPLSTRLQALSSADLRSASPADQADAISLVDRGAGSISRAAGGIVVEIRVSGDTRDRVGSLRDAGAEILHVSDEYATVTASDDERDLRDVAAVPGVESVQEVITPMVGRVEAPDSDGGAINTCATGTAISEGNTQLRAGEARTQFDVDGTGVKVGVLSDSFDTKTDASTHAANDIASNDLPGPGNSCGRTTPVQVVQDFTCTPATACGDEGRAMLQIVHDIAPGANLAFATANVSETAFADNVRALATAGSKVIVDDVIYFAEPFYQDGAVANAIRDVTQQGVSYFTMAFNNDGLGVNSYEAPAYRSTTCPTVIADLPGPNDCMDFDPGAGADNMFDINVTSGAFRLSFDYAEPQDGVTDDFDVYVLNGSGTTISFTGASANLTTQKPFEFAGGTLASAGARQIVIQRFSGSGTPRMKFVSNDNGANRITATQPVIAPDVQGPTIYGHNGTADAQTVGAVPFNNSATVEGFSSRGPVTHLFGPIQAGGPAPALASPEVLSKPNVAATDGGITTFFGPSNRFFGTSAAAPHAAAVGALQLEANPAQTNAQVKSDQRATAIPVGSFGPLDAGSGLIQATGALTAATTPFPTVAVTSGAGPTNRPSIAFTTTGSSVSAACSVDGGAPQPCTSPFEPSGLADGAHTVDITATDNFLHSGSATAALTVDTVKPKLKVKGPKKRTSKAKAKFKIKTEAGASLKCKLDKSKAKKCSKKPKFKVDPGKHKLAIQASDAAGNTAKLTYKWKVT